MKDEIFNSLNEEERINFEIENNYYCIATAAHNLFEKNKNL
jgi:hypothetical protein